MMRIGSSDPRCEISEMCCGVLQDSQVTCVATLVNFMAWTPQRPSWGASRGSLASTIRIDFGVRSGTSLHTMYIVISRQSDTYLGSFAIGLTRARLPTNSDVQKGRGCSTNPGRGCHNAVVGEARLVLDGISSISTGRSQFRGYEQFD